MTIPPVVQLRPATAEDAPVLWQMLFYAAHMAEDGATSPAAAKEVPFLAQYVEDWGQADDVGVIAEVNGEAIGAVWLQLLIADKASASYYDDQTPELAIAVTPAWLGQGIGTALMREMLAAARPHFPAIVLTVRADNPAVRLYERLGFTVIDEIINRVGNKSYKMLWVNQRGQDD